VTGVTLALEDEPVLLLVAAALVVGVLVVVVAGVLVLVVVRDEVAGAPAEVVVVVPVPLFPDPPVPAVVVCAAVDSATFSRASAGSWPVTRLTVISTHMARNRAIAPPTTRRRMTRTRSRRACLMVLASSDLMAPACAGRVSIR
jgi:hypothetical protein